MGCGTSKVNPGVKGGKQLEANTPTAIKNDKEDGLIAKEFNTDDTGLLFRTAKESSDNLLAASKRGNLAQVKEELAKGVDVNTVGMWGCTPLILALQYGYADIALSLLQNASINVNHATEKNATALVYACVNNESNVVRKLLQMGANPCPIETHPIAIESLEQTLQCTPFSIACICGNPSILELLIASGCNPNMIFKFPMTTSLLKQETSTKIKKKAASTTPPPLPINMSPLLLACRFGNLAAVRRLLDYHPNMNHVDSEICSCFHHAVHSSEPLEILTCLFDAKESFLSALHLCDCNGDSVLHIVSRSKQVEMVELMLEHGMDIDIQNMKTGDTSLHEAIQQKDERLVALLVKHNANPFLVNNAGINPGELAKTSFSKSKSKSGAGIRYMLEAAMNDYQPRAGKSLKNGSKKRVSFSESKKSPRQSNVEGLMATNNVNVGSLTPEMSCNLSTRSGNSSKDNSIPLKSSMKRKGSLRIPKTKEPKEEPLGNLRGLLKKKSSSKIFSNSILKIQESAVSEFDNNDDEVDNDADLVRAPSFS